MTVAMAMYTPHRSHLRSEYSLLSLKNQSPVTAAMGPMALSSIRDEGALPESSVNWYKYWLASPMLSALKKTQAMVTAVNVHAI